MIQFFLDQHIPSAIAVGLRQRDIDVLTAQEAGRCGFQDSELLALAAGEGRVVVSFDTDFLALAVTDVHHAGIAWCEATKYSVGQLIHALVLLHGVLSPEEMKDHVEYL